MYFTVLYCMDTVVQHLYFKLDLQEGGFSVQCEELTNEALMELGAQRKDKETQRKQKELKICV